MASANILGVFDDGFFSYNAVDLSDHVRGISLVLNRGAAETSAMGDDAAEFKAQRLTGTCSVQFLQSYYTSEAEATLTPDLTTSATRAILIRAKSGATSAVNPEYQFNAFPTSWGPVDGTYDDPMIVTLELQITGAVTRATS